MLSPLSTFHSQETPNAKEEYRVPSKGLSFLFLTWLTPLLQTGTKRHLEPEDLYKLAKENETKYIMNTFKASAAYQSFLASRGEHQSKQRTALRHAIQSQLQKIWCGLLVLYTIAMLAQVAVPFFLEQLIICLKNPHSSELAFSSNKFVLATVILMLQWVAILCSRTYEQMIRTLRIRLQILLMASIYDKALILSTDARVSFTAGKIMNLMGVDVLNVGMGVEHLASVVVLPLQVIICLALLSRLIGVSLWTGVGVWVFLFISQNLLFPLTIRKEKEMREANDSRLQVVRDMIFNMKYIKMIAQEGSFLARINFFRSKQMKAMKIWFIAFGAYFSITGLIPVVMPIVSISVYAVLNEDISVAKIFSALALFAILFQPILRIPQLSGILGLCYVCWKRISSLLLAEETTSVCKPKEEAPLGISVEIETASYKWPEMDEGNAEHSESSEVTKFQLSNITLTISVGSLTVIVGKTGAGKSSFLSMLNSEMSHLKGKVQLYGKSAYCCQHAWVFGGTIEENILFGLPKDQVRLKNAINGACLKEDLKFFKDGIFEKIGERGVNLSGGQKSRISLARAIYADADVYLLDDPLASLDPNVRNHVFDQGIITSLSSKTRILVTHQLHLLENVSDIIVLEAGRIVDRGSFKQLVKTCKLFSKMLLEQGDDDQNLDQAIEVGANSNLSDEVFAASRVSQISIDLNEKNEIGAVDIIEKEDRKLGSVSMGTYKSYVAAAGGIIFFLSFVLFAILNQAFVILGFYWLFWWSEDKFNQNTSWYLSYYAILGISQVVAIVISNAIMIAGSLRASKYYHKEVLSSVSSAQMSWFEKNPAGRIINRISQDMESMDVDVWNTAIIALQNCLKVFGILILVVIISPYSLIVAPFALVGFLYVAKLYVPSLRELKRINSMATSPIQAHLSETLDGYTTINAFGIGHIFTHQVTNILDKKLQSIFFFMATSTWASMRIEFISSFIPFFLIAVGSTLSSSGGALGIAIQYSLMLTDAASTLIQQTAKLENEMTSVERLQHYVNNVNSEAPSHLLTDPLSKGNENCWPNSGRVEVKNLDVAFPSRPLNPILKDLNFTICGSETVAVIGRSGSGKSTLIQALLRIVEPSAKSTILIDDINTASLGLNALRTCVHVIPQEPVLFVGTIRSNLTFFGKNEDATDKDIWEALRLVHLHQLVSNLEKKLDTQVAENGTNFSVGQRQLFNLARAILLQPKILLLDEATSSLDDFSCEIVDEVLQSKFSHSTVISVTHHVSEKELIGFDRIILLDKGYIVQNGPPDELFQDESFKEILAAGRK